MYRAYGLLRSDSDFSLELAHARLAAKFPGSTVNRDGDRVVVSKGEWWIALEHVSGPSVRSETAGLLGHLAGLEPAEALALTESARRVEVWTDVPDPFIEHFNDYLLVVEVLKTFAGLVAVDPKEPAVL